MERALYEEIGRRWGHRRQYGRLGHDQHLLLAAVQNLQHPERSIAVSTAEIARFYKLKKTKASLVREAFLFVLAKR